MKALDTPKIIHLFAVIHVAICLVFRAAGLDDSLILTMMTMMMVVLLCMKRSLSVEFTAVCIILVNVLGYLLGIGGAYLFSFVLDSPIAVHSVSTGIVTEIIGWVFVWFTKVFRWTSSSESWSPKPKWFLFAFLVLFLFRFGYVELFSSVYASSDDFYRSFSLLMSNAPALLITLCVNIIYIRYARRWRDRFSPALKTLMFICFILLSSAAVTAFAGYNLPFHINPSFSFQDFLSIFLIDFVLEVTLYAIVYMLDYAAVAMKMRDEARNKAHLAQFQYMKLKQQVNPHFLFNSLNILDYLVQDGRTEQAGMYIQKLAGIYRYMLKNEEESFVRLREEMVFVEMYVDLLKVRFADGFAVESEIPEEYMSKCVVPCSVQLLIENAIKHNAVCSEDPLVIYILVEDGRLSVRNALHPKMNTSVSSTGVGLKYIRQIYQDLSGKTIEVEKTDKTYSVTLPLI